MVGTANLFSHAAAFRSGTPTFLSTSRTYPSDVPRRRADHSQARCDADSSVQADNGLVGYAPGQGSERAKEGIESVIAPFLEGRTLTDPDALRVQFLESAAGRQLDLQKLYCAVEIALYDLVGKSKGVPVSELIGGRVRDRIRLYGSAGMYMAPEKYAEEAHAISELGFRAYKMRSGIGPEKDLETVQLMRDAVGPTST